MTWTNELDIIETDPGAAFVNTVVTTLHSNTSSDGGVADQINLNNNNTISNGPAQGKWHIFGLLWTQTEVTWFVDNVQVCTTVPFASTWQPVQLILSAGASGVNGSPSNVVPPITKVQWVRVWERPGYIGAHVKTITTSPLGVNIRNASGTIIGAQPTGTAGIIAAGPFVVPNTNYSGPSWEVTFATGPSGWVRQLYLVP